MSGAATRPCPELTLAQISEQLALAVDRVMSEGSLYDRELAALADQAGTRRPDRGDLPHPRLSHHASALRRERADRYRRDGNPPAHLGGVQGPAGRTGARPDFRLHPSAARRAIARRRRAGGPAVAGGGGGADAARHRPARRRRSDRAVGGAAPDAPVGDLTREPLAFPAERDLRLQTSRAATKAFCSRSAIRPSAAMAARIPSRAKSGSARSRSSSSPRTSALRFRSAASP